MAKQQRTRQTMWQRTPKSVYGAVTGTGIGIAAVMAGTQVATVALAGLTTIAAYVLFLSYQKATTKQWRPRVFSPAPVMGALVVGVMSVAGVQYLGNSNAASGPIKVDANSRYNTNSLNCAIGVYGTSNKLGQPNSQFTENGTSASTTVIVHGDDNCEKVITLASWTAPYGRMSFVPIKDQKLFASKAYTLKKGTHVLTVDHADCLYQIDMLYGTAITTPQGTAEYPEPQKLGWVQAGSKICTPPVVTPPTPTPTPTPTTPAPTPVAVPEPTPPPAVPVAVPAALPKTGPGNIAIVALFAIVTGYLFSALYKMMGTGTPKKRA